MFVGLVFSNLPQPVSIDVGAMVAKLCLYILVPMLIGKALRHLIKVAPGFCKRNKTTLKLSKTGFLLCIPWISVSNSGSSFSELNFVSFLFALGMGIGIHTVYLLFNYGCARLLRMELAELKAYVFSASQKTLAVPLTVITFLPSTVGAKGLLELCCIIAHLSQIFMDGYLAGRWANSFRQLSTDENTMALDVKEVELPDSSTVNASKTDGCVEELDKV
jgi:sodium/bile acid cotransporter 7